MSQTRRPTCFALALWSALILAPLAGLTAGFPQYLVSTLTMNDGLPLNQISAVVQTRDGYLWVATRNGLARFDGVRYGHRTAEAANILEHYGRTREEGFGPEVKRRIILGTYVLSSGYYDAYYLRAQKVRTLIRNDFLKAFEKCDAIVTPTTPTAAFKAGEKSDDPLQMYLSDIFTISCNLAGIPGVSVPCGFTKNPRLPVGLQLLGRPFGEESLLKIAHAYEQATPWHKEKAAI